MRKVFKWLGIGLGSILGVLAIAAAYIWYAGGKIANPVYDQPETSFVFDPLSADIEEGRRAALLRGCFDGCHGDGLEGAVWFDDVLFGRMIAPDLTRAFRDMSDQELDRVIRHGVRRDGRSTMLMPSSMLHEMSDEDLNNIMAFIRSQELTDGPESVLKLGLGARFFLLSTDFTPHAKAIRDDGPWLADQDPYGRYLAITVCTECHGMDLKGDGEDFPNLALVVAYTLDDFKRLMREGIALGDRELDLMKEVSTGRFTHFTDPEVEALYDYLVTLANGPLPAD